MWIKASGTRLADAQAQDIFVPCDLGAMQTALSFPDDRADRTEVFSLHPGGLRPSIETSLHAVFPQAVVVHVHCVNTIALTIRRDAKAALAARLAAFDWAFVPYTKPGAQLARAVVAARGAGADVLVFGNHGLIVAAGTVAEAEALLMRVVAALSVLPRALQPDLAALAARGTLRGRGSGRAGWGCRCWPRCRRQRLMALPCWRSGGGGHDACDP